MFSSEKTLGAHMCVKKRRHSDKGHVASRMGLELYRRFYEMHTATKNAKTMDEFIDSKYYNAFIKFARHLMNLRPVDQDRFVDFVFRNYSKDREWCKGKVYEAYIIDLLGKEPVEKGLERSILTMVEWGEKYNTEWTTFFEGVSPSEATHLVQMGKISPWVMFLAETSDSLWDRLSEEQYSIIDSVINTKIWMARFTIKKEDVTWARDTLHREHI